MPHFLRLRQVRRASYSWATPSLMPGRDFSRRSFRASRTSVVALHPRVVVILAGTNDIAGNTGPSTLEMIEDNMASMSEIAMANGIRVVLSSILPVYDYPWRPGLTPAPKIIAVNAWMKAYAARVGAVYLDYHSVMADERQGLPKSLSNDGVHPTEAGYKVMAPLADAAIADALRRP
jgi:lysophospholipase L1-like esterase